MPCQVKLSGSGSLKGVAFPENRSTSAACAVVARAARPSANTSVLFIVNSPQIKTPTRPGLEPAAQYRCISLYIVGYNEGEPQVQLGNSRNANCFADLRRANTRCCHLPHSA